MKTTLIIITTLLASISFGQEDGSQQEKGQFFSNLSASISEISASMTTPPQQKGDKMYDINAFSKAIENYQLVDLDSLTTLSLRKFAESYAKMNQIDSSMSIYKELILRHDCSPQDYFSYANILKMNVQYGDADKWMKKYIEVAPNEIMALKNTVIFEESASLLENNEMFKVRSIGLNSEKQEFAAGLYSNQLIYCANSTKKGIIIQKDIWSNAGFLDLYVSDISNLGELTRTEFEPEFNKKFHEGALTFTGDNNQVYYTANNYKHKSSDGTFKLDLYYSEKDELGNWSKNTPFQYNSDEYSIGHPWISMDGKTLYFSSDMPGGLGGADLYKCTIDSTTGSWSKPTNLGTTVNTEGDELFPYLNEEKHILTFSSNGHYGLGGFDIYMCSYRGDSYGKINNFGISLNSSYDDFGLMYNAEMNSGFFSSNRKGGLGGDDIYAVTMERGIHLQGYTKEVTGLVTDNFGNPVPETKIYIRNLDNNEMDSVFSDNSGHYSISLLSKMNYSIIGSKVNHLGISSTLSTDVYENTITSDVVLDHFVLIKGTVLDKIGLPVSGSKIILSDKMNQYTDSTVTDDLGNYSFECRDWIDFSIIGSRLNFSVDTNIITSNKVEDTLIADLRLERQAPDIDIIDGKSFLNVQKIYFDLASANLRSDTRALDEVVRILNDYPELKIELQSHTDCRGTVEYNQRLSDLRAISSAEYIKARITNKNRVYGRGYGEHQLSNGCKCNRASNCTPEEHQANRRTEFLIIQDEQQAE